MSSGSETSVGHEQQDSRSRSETQVWSGPQTSSSTTDRESDPELHEFIMRRNQVDKDTEVRINVISLSFVSSEYVIMRGIYNV